MSIFTAHPDAVRGGAAALLGGGTPFPRGGRVGVNALKAEALFAVFIGQGTAVSLSAQALIFGLGAQQVEDEFAHHGAVGGGMAVPFAAVVFAKDDVEQLVQAVFNAPVPPHIALKISSRAVVAAQIVTGFDLRNFWWFPRCAWPPLPPRSATRPGPAPEGE